MQLMDIQADNYKVEYNKEAGIISCEGTFMLNGTEEYAPILDLLKNAADDRAEGLILDLRKLDFLNSSGINTFTKFVIYVRNQNKIRLTGKGHEDVLWQVRLLNNLKRLLPEFVVELE